MRYLKWFFVLTAALFVAFFSASALVNRKYIGEISSLREEVLVRDRRITELQDQIEAARQLTPVQPLKQIVQVQGVTVADIQSALKVHGFYIGEPDGRIDVRTTEAIKKFQTANRISPDGIVGKRTWSLLREPLQAS